MKIKYRNGYYSISIKGKIKFEKKNIQLKIKRICRFAKRVFKNNLQILYIIVLLFIFLCITIPIGLCMQKYEDIFDGIWDFKGFIFSTIIIAFFVNTTNRENKRHRDLRKQFETYCSISISTESLVHKFIGILGYSFEGYIFIDEDNNDFFIKQLKFIDLCEWNIGNEFDCKEYLIDSIEELIKEIRFMENQAGSADFIGINLRSVNDFIADLNKDIRKIKKMSTKNIDEDFIKKYVEHICHNAYYPIATHRRPWRWDNDIDKEIRNLLEKENSHCYRGFDTLEQFKMPRIKKMRKEQKEVFMRQF